MLCFKRRTFVHGKVVRLAALDLVLWLVLARLVCVSFIINVFRVHLQDLAADVSGIRVPCNAFSDFEVSCHSSCALIAISMTSCCETERPAR